MSVREGYSRNEVAFLLSLSHEQAIEQASQIGSSLGKLTEEGHQCFEPDGSEVPLIARWCEVHAARGKVSAQKEYLTVLQLRLDGHTEQDISVLLGLNRRTVGRRWRATLLEILDILGGERAPMLMPLDHIDMCLKCGERPRARTTKRTRVWINNKWRWRKTDRPSSMCSACLESNGSSAGRA